MNQTVDKQNRTRRQRLRDWMCKYASHSPVIFIVVMFTMGIIFWGGFNTSMELTNTEGFCISCHEMRNNVYQEYKTTVHYENRTGVRATCPDCHVPKEWSYKVVRKIGATNELYHKVIGSIDTPEKFEAKRLELAEHVWQSMKETDSRECRNCHANEFMKLNRQTERSQRKHARAITDGLTCIDCHRGIAHNLPKGFDPDGTLHAEIKASKRPCGDCHANMPDTGKPIVW